MTASAPPDQPQGEPEMASLVLSMVMVEKFVREKALLPIFVTLFGILNSPVKPLQL